MANKSIQFFAIYNEAKYPVVKSDAKTVTLLLEDGNLKKVNQSEITRLPDAKPETNEMDDIYAEIAEHLGESAKDDYDELLDQPEKLELSIGQSRVYKFLTLFTKQYTDKKEGEKTLKLVIFRNPANGFTYSLGGYHPFNWFESTKQEPGYFLIKRTKDIATDWPSPMKTYRYQRITDQKIIDKLDAQMKKALSLTKESNDVPF